MGAGGARVPPPRPVAAPAAIVLPGACLFGVMN